MSLVEKIVNNYIFIPPPFDISKSRLIETEDGIPYRIIQVKPESPDPSLVNITIKLLYCHGNTEDVISAWDHVNLFLKSLHAACSYLEVNVYILCILWDYPGYSVSKIEMDLTVWQEQAKVIWKKLLDLNIKEECYDVYNIAWGYSIGTAMACYLSSEVSCDMVWLQAPFATLIGGAGKTVSAYFLGPWIDNISSLKNKNKNVFACAIFAGDDQLLPVRINEPELEPYLDLIIINAKADHEWFIDVQGIEFSVECFKKEIISMYEKRNCITIEKEGETKDINEEIEDYLRENP